MTKELLELFGAVGAAFAAGVGGTFALMKYITKGRIEDFERKISDHKTEIGKFDVGLKIAEAKVDATEERRQIADQRATIVSEEASTLKSTLANRDLQLLDLQRRLIAAETDARNAMPAERVKLLEESERQNTRFKELRDALLGSEEELWKLRGGDAEPALARAIRESRVRVLTVANLKGGVGKTTITLNLAAHYATVMNLRVLIIDFDYQGSLTATALSAANFILGSSIHADRTLDGERNGLWMVENPRDMSKILPNTKLITCGPTFDRSENQTMMRWLIGDLGDDVRYRLARLLVTPEVQQNYDIVLIDAPPRTSLGAVNALFASHGLIIPTVPDTMSVDAVGRFLDRMNKLRHLAPGLETALIVPSLTQETSLRPDEKDAMAEAARHLPQWTGRAAITKAFIRHFPTQAKIAGREVGYLRDKQYIKPAFDELGAEISEKFAITTRRSG